MTNAIDSIYFSDVAQEVFIKKAVSMATVANNRFESNLSVGQTVDRVILDITGNVRDVTERSDRTITTPTDSAEQLTVNLYKSVDYSLTKKELMQTHLTAEGGLEEHLASQAVKDLSADFDGRVLGETANADTKVATVSGAVKAVSSSTSSTPITLSTSNAPQVFARAKAGIKKNNVEIVDMCTVIDPDNFSVIEEMLAGRAADIAQDVFSNGYEGKISQAEVYVSNNLTNEITLTATSVVADNTLTIGGVTMAVKASPSAAGEIDLGASDTETAEHIVAAINGGAGAGTDYIEFSAADRLTLDQLRLTASNDGAVITITAKSGALSYSGSATFVEGVNFMHVYFGRKGTIDTVLQSAFDIETREEPKQKTTNFLIDYIGGYKLFADGKKKFVTVHLATI